MTFIGQFAGGEVSNLMPSFTYAAHPARHCSANPPGSGISRTYTPEQFRSRTYDFVLTGDIYPTTTDDTLLHLGYEALTPLELDLPFAVKIFSVNRSAGT